jgi:hypothetical protein
MLTVLILGFKQLDNAGSTLTLFMTTFFTNHPDNTIPANDLAIAADFFYRCANFHGPAPISIVSI